MSGYLHWMLAMIIQVALAEVKCGKDQFACGNGEKCIDQDMFCDGDNDCGENSDEIRRNNSEVQTGIPCRNRFKVCMLPERYLSRKDDFCTKNIECDDNEFACSDGSACIEMHWFCDEDEDCKDGSDEIKRNHSLPNQSGIPCRHDINICMLPFNQASKKAFMCTKNPQCDENEFACSDGSQCILKDYFCDDNEECNDNSDGIRRINSEVQTGIPCRRDMHVCMLPERYLSRKDEFCQKNTECDDNEFRCSDGSACLDLAKYCDDYDDCKDGSDEIRRNHSLPYQDGIPCRNHVDICMLPYNQASNKAFLCTKNTECEDDEFMCTDGSRCNKLTDFCDFYRDCSDGSDEIKANSNNIGIRCRLHDRVCILPDHLLTRKEKFCQKNVNCDDDQFRCADGNQCVSTGDFCDGFTDCDDGSDEVLFKIDSPESGIKCAINDLICVLPLSQGDKQANLCPNGTNCGFVCLDGSLCLSAEQFCDGTVHCSDGSDEMKEGSENPAAVGGSRCRRDIYKCILPDTQKIKKTSICQKKFECADAEFECLDNTQCLPFWWFCDGHADCDDGSDEMSVGSATDGLICRRDRHVCLLPQSQMSKNATFCRRPA